MRNYIHFCLNLYTDVDLLSAHHFFDEFVVERYFQFSLLQQINLKVKFVWISLSIY